MQHAAARRNAIADLRIIEAGSHASLLRLSKLRRDWSHPWPPFSRPDFLPETHAFGARLFDSLVNAVAALGVISLNGDSVLYTGFIIVPQFDRL